MPETAIPANPSTQRRHGTLAVLLLASTLGVMSGTILIPVLELLRSGLGISSTQAGTLLTLNGLTIAVVSPLTGWLVDRVGVRGPMFVGLLVYGLAGGAGLVTDDYTLLLASRVVFGIGTAMALSALTVAFLNGYRGRDRDRVMGWRTTAVSLGGVAWPLLGGALGGISWQAPFAVFLIGIPMGVAALFLVSTPETGPASGTGRSAVGATTLRAALAAQPALLGVFALSSAYMVITYGLLVFLPQRLAELGVHDPVAVSVNVSLLTGTSALVGLFYARLRQAVGLNALLRTTAALWTAAFLLLGLVDAVPALVAAAVLLGAGGGVWLTSLTVLMGVLAPAPVMGRVSSVSSTLVFVGQFLSPLLLGPLMAATSIATGHLVLATGVGAMALVLLFVRFPTDTEERGEQGQSSPGQEAPASGSSPSSR
ncbi:MFS transporter [Nocardiopsis exhalans]|uniref:MFS transporter n=1 Tax=Nocardiopsis exhalans TaxID=163604 RepID=A0ABY5D183_9ACTN|nr:MFS transporter [Nocardiopsis exhalans]USY18121.1 MFS transporter [Nocardiopsis exhalans]